MGKYHSRNFTRKCAPMRVTDKLFTILISSEELPSKSFQIPVPNDLVQSFESHPTPLHTSHKYLDLSLWKLTSFPESPYIPCSVSSCQICYLSGKCWNFPDKCYAKGKTHLSQEQWAFSVFLYWQYIDILYIIYKVPWILFFL